MPTRLIFHKFDPLTPAPGGIDTCIRGIIKYSDPSEELLIVGVASDVGGSRELGAWEDHNLDGRSFRFLPVAHLDPGNQVRRVPHSVEIALGLLKYRRRVPSIDTLQTHRADLGLVGPRLIKAKSHDYFIHTQESGILGKDSDSFWKRAGNVHRSIEKSVVKHATRVRVFNPSYAPVVEQWNAATKFSPTWWDPALVPEPVEPREKSIVWVGRLEQPKVPSLALSTLKHLATNHPASEWRLRMIGAGNLLPELKSNSSSWGLEDRVDFVGRLPPTGVMDEMSRGSILMMTSVQGYEGFPRVLVEGLANGLLAVVTKGADTGDLVEDGVNGFRTDPDPVLLAAAISAAAELNSSDARASVKHLSAPRVVADLYA
ncbi:glycosyltransferase [Herbiconiux liukaitaii]|uniref:glycosyltransferase n=1 Tax=Herbiconiux liukaitaii TaxID=3342799 RepID=UPI0035BA6D40